MFHTLPVPPLVKSSALIVVHMIIVEHTTQGMISLSTLSGTPSAALAVPLTVHCSGDSISHKNSPVLVY